jgi:hypothetical protein
MGFLSCSHGMPRPNDRCFFGRAKPLGADARWRIREAVIGFLGHEPALRANRVMVARDKKGPPMLEVKKNRAPEAQSDPTTASYVDRMEREGRPITLRIDDRPALQIEDERAYQMLWELVDRIETIEGVREGLEQMERGEGRPAGEVFEDMRKRHRLPRVE